MPPTYSTGQNNNLSAYEGHTGTHNIEIHLSSVEEIFYLLNLIAVFLLSKIDFIG